MDDKNWPAWRYGPGGEAEIFASEADVPSGWKDHPSKHEKGDKAAPPSPVSTPLPSATGGEELDTHGWPWDAALHASSKTKTTAGLWRMKVGASRPDPKPGYPLDL